jgi:hypothetical protein
VMELLNLQEEKIAPVSRHSVIYLIIFFMVI